jgi:hypothetical protein
MADHRESRRQRILATVLVSEGCCGKWLNFRPPLSYINESLMGVRRRLLNYVLGGNERLCERSLTM